MAALSGAPRITQETFDECVRENQEEFEMEKTEALADAIQQFTTQGVDLTNIDTSGEDRENQRKATKAAIESLQEAVTAQGGEAALDAAKCRAALAALTAACTPDGGASKDREADGGEEDTCAGDAAKERAGQGGGNDHAEGGGCCGDAGGGSGGNGGNGNGEEGAAAAAAAASRRDSKVSVNQAVIAMAKGPRYLAALLGHEPLVADTLACLAAVVGRGPHANVECRDAFPPQGMAVLAKILAVQAEQEAAAAAAEAGAAEAGGDGPDGGPARLGLAVQVCEVVALLCLRTEDNKCGFVKGQGLDALLAALKAFGTRGPPLGGSDPQKAALVRACCGALKSACTFDDLRKDFAGAFDSAKAAVKAGFVAELLRAGRLHETAAAEGGSGGSGGAVPSSSSSLPSPSPSSSTSSSSSSLYALGAVLGALRAIAMDDAAVQQISAGGGLALAQRALARALLAPGGGSGQGGSGQGQGGGRGGAGGGAKEEGGLEEEKREGGDGEGGSAVAAREQEEKEEEERRATLYVVRSAASLLRNLCGNDGVKTTVCASPALGLLLASVQPRTPHAGPAAQPPPGGGGGLGGGGLGGGGDPVLCEHVLGTLAAMALRSPANVDRILQHGGQATVLLLLRRFPAAVGLQRQGCLAVRNLVGRSPHLRAQLLGGGLEALLRHAGTLPGSVDAAFAALRDLGCAVEMVTLDAATGQARVGVEQFGEVKSAFRAVYDDGPDENRAREAAIAANAKSPAELGYKF